MLQCLEKFTLTNQKLTLLIGFNALLWTPRQDRRDALSRRSSQMAMIGSTLVRSTHYWTTIVISV